MWTVLKFDKKNFHLLKEDLKKKVGCDCIIYRPKIRVQKYKNNKLISRELDLLDDYLLCFHKKFQKKSIINQLKFSRGLKYFLDGFVESQLEVKNFLSEIPNVPHQSVPAGTDEKDNKVNVSKTLSKKTLPIT